MTTKNERPPQRELPNAIEAEQALLGALMMKNDVLAMISSILEPKHFFEPLHGEIYEACQTLILRGSSANPVSVRLQIQKPDRVVGDMTIAGYLSRLLNAVVGMASVVHQAQGIKETYLRRKIISLGGDLVEFGYNEGDPVIISESMDIAQAECQNIGSEILGKAGFYGSSLMDDYATMITKVPDRQNNFGVPIALRELQTVISEKRFQPGRLYGILSSSGSGKTSLILQLMYKAMMDGHPVLFLSYDQSGRECVAQMVAQNAGIEVRRQQMGDLTEKDVDRAMAIASSIAQMAFQVVKCDSTKDTAARLAGFSRTFAKRNYNGKTPMIVVDHIGTIKPDHGDRNADEGTKARNIGQQLKSLATEINAAVIVLQQRNGAGMKRPNPRPISADLYGGEVAKQPFDVIAWLYRPEAAMKSQLDTAIDAKEQDKIRVRFIQQCGEDIDGIAEIGAIKVRFGNAFQRRRVRFIAEFTRYESEASMDNFDQEELL